MRALQPPGALMTMTLRQSDWIRQPSNRGWSARKSSAPIAKPAMDLAMMRRRVTNRSMHAAGTALVMAAEAVSADVGVPPNGGAVRTNAPSPR
jgi:hypothetical protein